MRRPDPGRRFSFGPDSAFGRAFLGQAGGRIAQEAGELFGGLGALQAMAVSTGFPFTIVLLLACYTIIKGLRDEPR